MRACRRNWIYFMWRAIVHYLTRAEVNVQACLKWCGFHLKQTHALVTTDMAAYIRSPNVAPSTCNTFI